MHRRRTKAQIEQLRRQMVAVLAADHPQSIRHVFYRMTDPRLPEPVEKSNRGYTTVQRQLVKLRRAGEVPYGWIVDSTRRGFFVDTYEHVADAVAETARFYRRSIWSQTPVYVECWCESRSIAGVILQETERYAVPLYPSGGFASLSLAHEAAKYIARVYQGRAVHVLYLGDYDPAGILIDGKIEQELRLHLPDNVDLSFHRLAVTPEQINLMGLPTKPTADRRGGWRGGTVEAEAIPAGAMRHIVREAIESFIDQRALTVMQAAEASEQSYLLRIAEAMRGQSTA